MTGDVARAAAPVRLDFAGGWTDVPPFSAREGGVVVTAAISLFARAEAARRCFRIPPPGQLSWAPSWSSRGPMRL